MGKHFFKQVKHLCCYCNITRTVIVLEYLGCLTSCHCYGDEEYYQEVGKSSVPILQTSVTSKEPCNIPQFEW